MNKIYTGIVALVAMLAIVSGSAYALFSSQVEINGIELGTTTSGLKVKLGLEPDAQYATTTTLAPAYYMAHLSPGQTSTPGVFWLRNTGAVQLNLTARITSAAGNWGELSPVLEGVTCTGNAILWSGTPFDSTPTGCNTADSANSTGWANLAYWNTNEVPLPGGPLAVWNNIANPGSNDRMYVSFYRLPASADNSVANMTITNMKLGITGTQVAAP